MKNKNTLSLVLFFSITFIFSWFFWSFADDNPIFLIIGRFGPTVSAISLMIIFKGIAGLRSILSGLIRWKVGVHWYLFIFGSTFIIPMLAIFIFSLAGGTVIQTNDPAQWYLIIPAFFQILIFSVLGEEIGWRGYALPLMQKKFGPFLSSIILGIIWGLWHLPLFWMDGNFHSDIPVSLFLLQSIALTLILTWLYNRTSQSLFVVHIFHAASNTFLGVLPIMPENTGSDVSPLWIAVGLLWTITMLLLAIDRKNFFMTDKKSPLSFVGVQNPSEKF